MIQSKVNITPIEPVVFAMASKFTKLQGEYFKLFALAASGAAVPKSFAMTGMQKLIDAGIFKAVVTEQEVPDQDGDDFDEF